MTRDIEGLHHVASMAPRTLVRFAGYKRFRDEIQTNFVPRAG